MYGLPYQAQNCCYYGFPGRIFGLKSEVHRDVSNLGQYGAKSMSVALSQDLCLWVASSGSKLWSLCILTMPKCHSNRVRDQMSIAEYL